MPASASFVAQPNPMPLLAPVTIATCMSVHPLVLLVSVARI